MGDVSAGPKKFLSEFDRVADVVGTVSFPGYQFVVSPVVNSPGYFVQVRYLEPDVFTGVVEEQWGRKWYVPPGQTAGQIVQTCFKALLTSLEHRARENFLYRGKPVLQPHLDVDQLWAMMPDSETHTSAVDFGSR